MDRDELRLDVVNDNLKLYQFRDGLTFGTDALLLAGYVSPEPGASALELGGGTGIVSLLLATRNKVGTVLALEAQEEYARLTEENARIRVAFVLQFVDDMLHLARLGEEETSRDRMEFDSPIKSLCQRIFGIQFVARLG